MAFHGANNFVVNGTINAVDNSQQGGIGFNLLVEAACLGAGHQSGERYDRPKCHPETRKSVMNDIMSWVDSANAKEKIMWLNGPAGAGKSAIMQSISERCHKEKKLIASFFFSRTATGTGRDDGTRLIPTIAYQLAILIPIVKDGIITQLEQDPAILFYSNNIQLEKLLVNPLSDANIQNQIESGLSRIPHLVIIDGLDECKEPDIQSSIITAIAGILSANQSIHLRFLIASRPELKIRQAFDLQVVKDICVKLTLNETYDPDKDIEVYLRSEFHRIKRTHTLSPELSDDPDWPSQEALSKLVEKSSGQFIYASTVVKYIGNDRRDPRESMQTIVSLSAIRKSEESPYAELDAVYTHILSVASAEAKGYNNICLIFQALLYIEQSEETKVMFLPDILAEFIDITHATLWLRFVDLHSIVFIPTGPYSHNNAIRFFHASINDFLKDPSRSNDYFISKERAHARIAQWCLAGILKCGYDAMTPLRSAKSYARTRYFMHFKESNFDDELLNELREQNIPRVMAMMLSNSSFSDIDRILQTVFKLRFLAGDIDILISAPEKLEDICTTMRVEADKVLLKQLRNDTSLRDYAIAFLIEARRHPTSSSNNNSYCWMATLLESPERGKHFFLYDKKCRNLFVTELQKLSDPNEVNKSMGSMVVHRFVTMGYLLGRIKPSIKFGIFLQKELRLWLDTFITNVSQLSEKARLIAPCGRQIYNRDYHDQALNLKEQIYVFLQECFASLVVIE